MVREPARKEQAMMRRAWGLAIAVGWVAAFVAPCGLGSPALAQQPMAPQAILDKLVLSDTIQPVTAGQLDRAIAQANSDGAQALLVELDTPGGLLRSTRRMGGAML